jgi:hypothetical protein
VNFESIKKQYSEKEIILFFDNLKDFNAYRIERILREGTNPEKIMELSLKNFDIAFRYVLEYFIFP